MEVCIVSFHSAAVLGACLDSIVATIPGVSVAIREHGGDPSDVASLVESRAREAMSIRFEHDPTNPGFGAGCNALAAGSSADHLLFLNPDAEIQSWPWSVASPPPTAAILGPMMLGDGEAGRHAGVGFRIRDEIARSWLRRTGPLPHGRGFVSGAALLVDRGSFAAVGCFDEAYFLFYEDIDLCLRANDHGVTTQVDERWTVRHSGGHSTSERFGQALGWSYASACRFHATHGSNLAAYRIYVTVDALARAAVRAATGRRSMAAGHLALARRAMRDLLTRREIRSVTPGVRPCSSRAR